MFCNQCGSELLPGAAFCARCGHPVEAAPANSAEAPQSLPCTVTFTREKQWFAVNPAVRIVVDDRDEYLIENGQTLRVSMAQGTHNIAFRCGIRNKVIDLTVQRDLALTLRWNRVTGSLIVQ